MEKMAKYSAGFTMLELVVTLALLSLMLAMAMPSFTKVMDKTALKGAARTLYGNLQLARSEAIKLNKDVYLSFKVNAADAKDWCYGLDDTADCDCRVANSCTVGGQERVISSAKEGYKNISMDSSNYAQGYARFDWKMGTSDVFGSALLTSDGGLQLKVLQSSLGRVRVCSPGGGVSGYSAC